MTVGRRLLRGVPVVLALLAPRLAVAQPPPPGGVVGESYTNTFDLFVDIPVALIAVPGASMYGIAPGLRMTLGYELAESFALEARMGGDVVVWPGRSRAAASLSFLIDGDVLLRKLVAGYDFRILLGAGPWVPDTSCGLPGAAVASCALLFAGHFGLRWTLGSSEGRYNRQGWYVGLDLTAGWDPSVGDAIVAPAALFGYAMKY